VTTVVDVAPLKELRLQSSTIMTPAELLLGLVLTGTQSHYEFVGVIDDKRLEHLLLSGKQILYKSHQESDVRQSLGFSKRVWAGLTKVLLKAIPVLEVQSFSWKNPPHANFGGSSSDLIAANYLALVKDIERLNDLCTIARNLLATTKRAQNLASDEGFDQQILKLIDVCVRVTARGFDGEGGNQRNEDRWSKVVNLYKRLLITCLQFLHNFIMHNETRKLSLWLDLFGNQSQQQIAQQSKLSEKEAHADVVDDSAVQERVSMAAENVPDPSQTAPNNNIEDVEARQKGVKEDDHLDVGMQEDLVGKVGPDVEGTSDMNSNQLDADPNAPQNAGGTLRTQVSADEELPPTRDAAAQGDAARANRDGNRIQVPSLPDLSSYTDPNKGQQEITEEDLQMPRTSQSAAETLQEAKDELMARLEEPPSQDGDHEDLYDDAATASGIVDDDLIDSGEDLSEGEEEDDDESEISSYRQPGDQERGLLTDVPLVLGPTEIEALPMIIQAGIVDNFGNGNNKNSAAHTAAERQSIRSMQSVRCHILLAQEAGRNVLRELLIFIAAWDLPDDEFYFKMMVQIMEAILKNGLMSHAYADFGQAKDIISPAQAVVVKILTHIYRGRYSPASVKEDRSADKNRPISEEAVAQLRSKVPAALTRVDVLTVRYIFTVFRGNIVPETCALIYLQGQIRQGLALAEDFPLNLWDMERVYEGVYQFLEFFAVLTENNDWKRLLVDWEIVYDLVTLIKELEAAIPKLNPLFAPKARDTDRDVNAVYQGEAAAPSPTPTPPPPPVTKLSGIAPGIIPVAVERPYSLSPPSSSPVPHPTTRSSSPGQLPGGTSAPAAGIEEPSTFEWRNLKKLIILVLSSLVWKSTLVQNQIRLHGGVDTVLSCTVHDANNPYIREHALMCLKFLLEGNKENQALVAELESRGVKDAYDPNQGGFSGGSFGGGFTNPGGAGGRAAPLGQSQEQRKRRAASDSAANGSATGLGPVEARRLRERFGELSFGELGGVSSSGPSSAAAATAQSRQQRAGPTQQQRVVDASAVYEEADERGLVEEID
jgi:palmitoyltransferase